MTNGFLNNQLGQHRKTQERENPVKQRRSLMIVDDEAGIGQLCAEFFAGKYETHTFTNPQEAIEAYESIMPDLIITDLKMPKTSGFDLIKTVREKYPLTPFILMSGYAQKTELMHAMDLRVVGFVEKPFHPDRMISLVEATLSELDRNTATLTSKEVLMKVLDGSMTLNELYKDRYIRAENLLFDHDIRLTKNTAETKQHLEKVKVEQHLERKIEDTLSMHKSLFHEGPTLLERKKTGS